MTTVSLVEDDLSFALLLRRTLSKCRGIRVVGTYATAEQALHELPRAKPDVILVDIKLPGMNGIECLRRLKRISPPLLSHVLILTEYEDSDVVFEALKAGASGYLLKDRIPAAIILIPRASGLACVHEWAHACGISHRGEAENPGPADGLMQPTESFENGGYKVDLLPENWTRRV